MLTALDTVLDRTLVPGYSKLGYLLRRRGWTGDRADPPRGALAGRTALVTGAGSGLGEAAATGLARLGATVHLLVRSMDKGRAAQDRIADAVPGLSRERLPIQICDVGELAQVRAFATRFATETDALDVLVHNAGLMPEQRSETSEGNELALAVHVLGPLLLTRLLADTLATGAERSGTDSRVIIVSSGGMYAQPLHDDDLQFTRRDYGGTAAYARTKRMQVVATGLLADELAPRGVTVHALHPGWAATPGVTGSLPLFDRIVGPVLRTPAQGADTAVWLAAAPSSAIGTGRFWHDRTPRPTHYLSRTRETAGQRERFRAEVDRLTR
ncbi:SDR family NAD(P)-dependent oxidoreductase [Pseudonocardia parietis]|uniref:NAD(P)-dependent dehydrogenase (Short-subunit alcohol dehydrogenase family) n=1 Tax=Pseudonocardia parietis TaxID=570936 RepID=A0ABS4VZR2_9PSEU|nr:SDR family NAD(P)-dependent oxidoreductase [Pseudonocardia parietis]MBP2369411.1 NAD(P)-dependent dehydrogenase (short-subunit alcohol dehydrogenase family) [Pseudonocardia parietis]